MPGLEVKVERNHHITVNWVEPDGTPKSQEFTHYEAVIVQHELDHLEGNVLLDRVSGFRRRRYMKRRKKAGVL